MIQDANWISTSADIGEICPIFSKKIKINKTVKKAVISISATGVYEARLNDKRIGDFILAPGCTSYKSRLQYQTYDITDMINDENVLSICLGKGWYRGRISVEDKAINQTDGAVIAELIVTYSDGSEEKIITDNSWDVSTSHILFSDIYDGETYDALSEIKDLGKAFINDTVSKTTLIEQEGETVKEQKKIYPVRMFTTPKGERVIDFGQNIAGYVSLNLTAKSGDRVVISHGEVLDSDGNFYNENYRSSKSKLEYICRDGSQTYKPFFSYFGFRYIRLDECPKKVSTNNFTAIAVYSDMKRTGYIETENKKVNYDTRKFFGKWLGDVRAEQHENGSVPEVVPNFWCTDKSSAAWGDAITVIPWTMYMMYGDKSVLEINFDAMKRWVDFMTVSYTHLRAHET